MNAIAPTAAVSMLAQFTAALAGLPNKVRILETRSRQLDEFLLEHKLGPPLTVEHRPLAGCRIEQCFANVDRKVKQTGGRMEFGWAFVEELAVSLHATAHAVWITPQGARLDITPWRCPPARTIQFLPDERIALKLGHTAGCFTVYTRDPIIRSVVSFNRSLDALFEEHYSGPDTRISVPELKLKNLASRTGVLWPIAQAAFASRLAHNGL